MLYGSAARARSRRSLLRQTNAPSTNAAMTVLPPRPFAAAAASATRPSGAAIDGPTARSRHSGGTKRGTTTSAARKTEPPTANQKLCLPETATPIATMPNATKSSTTAGSDRSIARRPNTAAATRITPMARRKSVATSTLHRKALPPPVSLTAIPGQTATFVAELAAARIGGTYNQYADSPLRRARLAEYLEARRPAPLLVVGEAAGYRGARVSGLPFTSERQLTGRGPAEATATIVHRVLERLGLAEDVLLWNVVPTHPGTASSNRPPTPVQVAT